MEGGRYSRTHAIHYDESGPESSDFTSKDDIKYQPLKQDVVKFRYENPSCILRNYSTVCHDEETVSWDFVGQKRI